MKRGYVKLWRKTLDNGMMLNPKLLSFWAWCLMKASHRPIKIMVGYQVVALEAGQFVFGRDKAASALNLSSRTVRTCLETLKNAQQLTIKATNKYSIISIVNWELYQGDSCDSGQQNDQQPDQQTTNKRPTNDQQTTTNKNVKNVENVKNKPIRAKKPAVFEPPTPDEVALYFRENGYSDDAGRKAHGYYAAADWHDSKGNPVRNWKQKMRGVWFRDENKTKVEPKDIPGGGMYAVVK